MNKHLRIYYCTGAICLLFLCCPGLSLAQITAERQVLTSTGNAITSGIFTVSQTSGESFTTTLFTSPFTATQGFEQVKETEILGIDLRTLGIDMLHVYPNPVSKELTLSAEFVRPIDLSFTLYDLLGKRLLSISRPFNQIGSSQKQVMMEKLPEGHYVAVFQVAEGDIVYKKIVQRWIEENLIF